MSLNRVYRPVHAGRYKFTVQARYIADNDDGLRITMSVERHVNARDPDDACGDGTGLIEAALELAFPKADGWMVEPEGLPEVEAEGWDEDDR